MDVHRFTLFNIVTVSLPLIIFLLLSWASSTTTTAPPSPPPPSSSVLSAAQILRAHGYSLFANALISASSTNANFSGTILAPPDFSFSSSGAKFSAKPFRHAPPRPATALLRYHTLQIPSLKWFNLISRPDGDELQTHYNNNYCLFIFKNANGGVALSSSKKPIHAVTIRQPNLYSDDTLTIHGVDGVLDPTAAKKCSFSSKNNPTAGIQSPTDRSFLDHAIRVLRTRGFHVVATAMALRRSELLTQKAVTVFAPSDTALFSVPNGFRYDFRHHIVPERLRFTDIVTLSDGTEVETLAPNKTVFIRSGEEDIRINGVRVDGGELYHNRWIVVYPISMTLDDAVDEYPSSLPENHFPDNEEIVEAVPSAAPASTSELIQGPSPSRERDISGQIMLGVPVVAPMSDQGHLHHITGESIEPPSLSPETLISAEAGREVPGIAPTSGIEPIGPPFRSPEIQIPDELVRGTPVFAPINGHAHIPDMTGNSIGTLSPGFAFDEVTGMHCTRGSSNDVVPGFAFKIEGGDLFCPLNNVQDL